MGETGPKSFIVARWTNKIRSLSIRRKFHLRGWTRRGRIKLSLRLKHSARRVSPSEGERRTNSRKEELFEESLPSFVKLSHLSEFLRKSIHPRQGKIRGRKRRRGFLCSLSLPLYSLFSSLFFSSFRVSVPYRPSSSEASKRAGAWAAFRFPYHFAPFTRAEKRCEKGGWLLLLSSSFPVTVYSDFHPVFFSRLSVPLCFSNLFPIPLSSISGGRPVAVQIIVTARRCWPNISRNERISLAKLVIRDKRKLATLFAFSPRRSFPWPRSESNRSNTLFFVHRLAC